MERTGTGGVPAGWDAAAEFERVRVATGVGYLGAAVVTLLAVVLPDPDPRDHPALLVITVGVGLVVGLWLSPEGGRALPLLSAFQTFAAFAAIGATPRAMTRCAPSRACSPPRRRKERRQAGPAARSSASSCRFPSRRRWRSPAG